jgi:hypothetical protein
LLCVAYGLTRLVANGVGLLARDGWFNWVIGGVFAFLSGMLIRQLASGRRRLKGLPSGGVQATGTIVVNVRDRRTDIRKCTISRRPDGWLVELYDRAGDLNGKGEAPAYAGLAGPDSFPLTDPHGNTFGQCDVTSAAGIIELIAHDRDGILLARGRFSVRKPQPSVPTPWPRPSATQRPA